MTPVRPKRQQVAKTWPTKTITVSYSVYQRDDEMVQELKDYLGTTQSDVIRTAVRTLYVKLLGKDA